MTLSSWYLLSSLEARSAPALQLEQFFALSQKPPPPNPAQLCHGDPGDSFGTALGTGYCLAFLYLQISKHFVNVKPQSLSREQNSFCYCTDGEACPKMRAELERQQSPELSQLSFLLAQSTVTQIIPGRPAWTNTSPGRNTHSPGGKAWHARAPKNLFTTGAPNHNVSPIFQFSSLDKKNTKKPKKSPPQFYSFNFLENYLKKTEQKPTMILKI